MPRIALNKEAAKHLLRHEGRLASDGPIDPSWRDKIERLSSLCDAGASKTHIAFLGTAILAKALNHRVDLYFIKPNHAPANKNSYSARTLCHSVLVPLSAELGVHLGVTGREPLNNQPYFRMTHLGDSTPVHGGGREAFEYMLRLISELNKLQNEDHAYAALRAFIAIRREFQPRYNRRSGAVDIAADVLAGLIAQFVSAKSEHGKRAQAVAAGILDVFAGAYQVEMGRINDPSRGLPGDVCVRSKEEPKIVHKAFEVRDKPVSDEDAQIFIKKCVDVGVREAAIVMVSANQPVLNAAQLHAWANEFGIGVTLFFGWRTFVEQALFWAEVPKPDAVALAVERITDRLIQIEASPASIQEWQNFVGLT